MDVKMIISLFFCFLLLGCNTSENNQIKVSIKVVDSYTHEPRVNDRVKVLIGKWGFQQGNMSRLENIIQILPGSSKT